MPKNKGKRPRTEGFTAVGELCGGKGGKNRRRGKNENESEKRELVFKEDGQEYAQVIKMLGNGRLEAMCFDGTKRLCHIRGKLRKKVWINTSDIILVGLRDYQDNKADVILKYNADEARSLKAYGELPEHAKINETDTFGPGDDDEIQFDDIGDDDEDIDDILSLETAQGLMSGCFFPYSDPDPGSHSSGLGPYQTTTEERWNMDGPVNGVEAQLLPHQDTLAPPSLDEAWSSSSSSGSEPWPQTLNLPVSSRQNSSSLVWNLIRLSSQI
ncbi:hypothetical protein GOODEAATRI_000684 [Goodea atripinnis]|uniref:Eukaryotic translation initiation factor 4C n=1 Tax=Goodea atripinnis TaxID=208336 RepID=A0ABV0N6S8_9TELE